MEIAVKSLPEDARNAEKNRRKISKLPPKVPITETKVEIQKMGEKEYTEKIGKKQSVLRKWADAEKESAELAWRTHSTADFGHNAEINKKVALIQGDITFLEIDAVVNAANESLLGGGGIDGAIHKAAGQTLRKECFLLQGAEIGETKITRGHDLPAKYILHTVGPRGKHEEKLISCYKSCLDLCRANGIRSVALCGISTGIFGYPLYDASHVALRVVRQWLENPKNFASVDLIIFCTFLEKEVVCYDKLMPMYFPPEGMDTAKVVAKYQEVMSAYDANDETMGSDGEDIKTKKEEEKEEEVKEKNQDDESPEEIKDENDKAEVESTDPKEDDTPELKEENPSEPDAEPIVVEEATR